MLFFTTFRQEIMTGPMILILGITGSGKGRLAFELAKSLDAEIVSIDSMKVYRRMDIGTAKPPKEARRQVKCHLIDVVEPSESFSVGRFLEMANTAIDQIKSRDKPVIAVGGTALYIKALLFGLFDGPAANPALRQELKNQARTQGLNGLYKQLRLADPAAAERINPNDEKRIIRALEVYRLTGKPISQFQQQWDTRNTQYTIRDTRYDWKIIGLQREKTEENKRINARVKKMLDAGLVDEVRSLLEEQIPPSRQARSAIGYAEIIDYLQRNTDLDNAIELIKKNTRRFAKSQRTWFKTFKNVNWLDVPADKSPRNILDRVLNLLKKNPPIPNM